MDLSVLIINWNTRELLHQCLTSIYETVNDLEFEIMVVDNNSTDGSCEMIRESFPEVHLIENTENVGFAHGNNQAIKASRGRYTLLFNSDAIAQPNSIQAMVAYADDHPDVAIVGAQLLNADGSFQASHTRFPNLGRELLILSGLGRLFFGPWYPSHGPNQGNIAIDADYVEGACMLARRKAIDEVGGLDEGYFMYTEEVDWCFNIRQAGWRVVHLSSARIIHLGGGSSSKGDTRREALLYGGRIRFFHKHFGTTQANLLKGMIYSFTLLKNIWHRLSRGRNVVGWRELRNTFQEYEKWTS